MVTLVRDFLVAHLSSLDFYRFKLRLDSSFARSSSLHFHLLLFLLLRSHHYRVVFR